MIRHARLPRSAMRPLCITATLRTAVDGDVTLPFDSILHYIIHRDAYGREDLCVPGEPVKPDGHRDTALPLARVNEDGPMWFYAASWAQWPASIAEGGDHWSSRFPLQRTKFLDTARTSIDTASGPYKGYRMPIFYRHALSICWYVVGEPSRIERLLPHMTHLGKKTSQGWGTVGEWRVQESEHDYSVRGPDGKLMRAVPSEQGVIAGFRPSYWYSKNQAPCLLPS